MAITVPQPGQDIDATLFGAPVANALNALTPARCVAGIQATKVQPGLAQGIWSDVTGMSVSFTAKANWLYLIDWQANIGAGAQGIWVAAGLKVDGAAPGRFVANMAAPSSPAYGYGLAVHGTQFLSSKLGGVFTAGVHSLQLQVTSAGGGGLGVDGGAPCWIGVFEWGADT